MDYTDIEISITYIFGSTIIELSKNAIIYYTNSKSKVKVKVEVGKEVEKYLLIIKIEESTSKLLQPCIAQ